MLLLFYVYLVGDKWGKEPPIDLKKKNEGALNFYIWQMLLSNAIHSEWIQANSFCDIWQILPFNIFN